MLLYILRAQGNFQDPNETESKAIAKLPAGKTTILEGVTLPHRGFGGLGQLSDIFYLQDPTSDQLINFGRIDMRFFEGQGGGFIFFSDLIDENSDSRIEIPANANMNSASFIVNVKLYEKDGQLKETVDVTAGLGK